MSHNNFKNSAYSISNLSSVLKWRRLAYEDQIRKFLHLILCPVFRCSSLKICYSCRWTFWCSHTCALGPKQQPRPLLSQSPCDPADQLCWQGLLLSLPLPPPDIFVALRSHRRRRRRP